MDDMIEEKKRMLNTSLEEGSLRKSMEVRREKILPDIKPVPDKK